MDAVRLTEVSRESVEYAPPSSNKHQIQAATSQCPGECGSEAL
jgi:hypothetical protein